MIEAAPGWYSGVCHQLIDARLAASAHIIHPVTSIYRWQGTIHETTEARAFLRSRYAQLDELSAYVLQRHPTTWQLVEASLGSAIAIALLTMFTGMPAVVA